MKVVLIACSLALCMGGRVQTNPIQKVISMVSDLEVKVIAEGDSAHKLYEEFAESCEDRSRELHFEIKTGKANVAELTATIADKTAQIESLSTKIEELSGTIATAEADLKAATRIREKEAADFAVEDKELSETIDTIERAIRIIEREMQKGGSFAQLQGASGLQQALAALVQASSINAADATRLTALVQSSSDADDAGAPDAAVYESQSGGITDALEGLLTKAQDQLAEARKTESTSRNNFEMLKQSLEDEIKYANRDMDAAKKASAENKEKKAAAEGDLDVTSKDLAEDEKALSELHHDCMAKASNYEDETKSRGEELNALATAKKIIKDSTSGAVDQTYGLAQLSFFQASAKEASAHSAVVGALRRLAFDQKSASLAQLVERVESAMRTGASQGSNPFAKVESLITDMIERLEKEAAADATHKAYCDKEMSETTTKKDDKTSEIEKMTTKIDQMSAASAKLKEEVATLQQELAALAKAQLEMDKLREEEHAAYSQDKPEMEQGIEGIKMALKVLRDYYAKDDTNHEAADGAASGIIGLLEVAESDFSKGLAEMEAKEESAAAAYEAETKENEITKAKKTQDQKYKTQESTTLDKNVDELTSDRSGVQEELDAVLQYLKELRKECVAKAETYEEQTARREAEIAGLKEALSILSNDTAFLQRRVSRHGLRGA